MKLTVLLGSMVIALSLCLPPVAFADDPLDEEPAMEEFQDEETTKAAPTAEPETKKSAQQETKKAEKKVTKQTKKANKKDKKG